METLLELIDGLEGLNDELTLYARGGAAAEARSPAVAARSQDDGTPPREAEGMDYVLEVDLALEAIGVWSAWREGRVPSRADRFAAVIHYARYDAYLPLDDER